MIRTAPVFAVVVALLALSAAPARAESRLLRQPTYSNGRVAFSYLGDLWIAERRRLQRPPPDRPRRPRHLPAILAGREMDRLLVQPRGELRRVRDVRRGRQAEAAHLPQRGRQRRRLVGGREEGPVHLDARRRRVPERGDALRDPGRGRHGAADAAGLGLVGELLAGRVEARLHPSPRRLVAQALPRQLRGGPVADGRRRQAVPPARRLGLQGELPLADVRQRRPDLLRRRPAAGREGRQVRQPGGDEEHQQHLADPRVRRRRRCR